MARFQSGDVFIDLGCGSGKIVVAAAMSADVRASKWQAAGSSEFTPRYRRHVILLSRFWIKYY
jgi:predicted RNA methylase